MKDERGRDGVRHTVRVDAGKAAQVEAGREESYVKGSRFTLRGVRCTRECWENVPKPGLG